MLQNSAAKIRRISEIGARTFCLKKKSYLCSLNLNLLWKRKILNTKSLGVTNI